MVSLTSHLYSTKKLAIIFAASESTIFKDRVNGRKRDTKMELFVRVLQKFGCESYTFQYI